MSFRKDILYEKDKKFAMMNFNLFLKCNLWIYISTWILNVLSVHDINRTTVNNIIYYWISRNIPHGWSKLYSRCSYYKPSCPDVYNVNSLSIWSIPPGMAERIQTNNDFPLNWSLPIQVNIKLMLSRKHFKLRFPNVNSPFAPKFESPLFCVSL